MQRYKVILLVSVLCLVGCSQKDESPENTNNQKNVVSTQSIVHKVAVKKISKPQETVSKSYIETVELELSKMKEEVPVSLAANYVESELEVSIPAHIRNSTIESVPR